MIVSKQVTRIRIFDMFCLLCYKVGTHHLLLNWLVGGGKTQIEIIKNIQKNVFPDNRNPKMTPQKQTRWRISNIIVWGIFREEIEIITS